YDEKLFFTLIKTSFHMRRKTLLNVLKTFGLSIDELVEVFNDAEIDSSRRGETLSIDEFADLSNSLK
ncbi:MAG TPA: 16S rRNA (adenine(1518)-N(6)/adenine(1519)-N(6))-dimethyltransferase, partial [Clostridiaceae bacterium]|nr:16S rRNA (adenine(1518)-N(6)/adenine(1519)-N(6))-dimethyltransferase [Clostridiaceae bacterium]